MSTELISAISAAIIAIISCIITTIQNKQLRSRQQTIEQALTDTQGERYYIVCPHCQQKIYLDTVKILYDKQSKES